MSSISGIGGGGMGISLGGGAGLSVGGSGATSAGTSTTGASTGAQSPGASLPENLQSLVDAMKDFSSAEILIALMLSSGGKDDDKRKHGGCGGAAGGFLAGMAMAGMMGQQPHLNLQVDVPFPGANGAVGGTTAGAGLSLNVSI